ncbi:hypothetical protein [Mucilaginibacter sp. UR6-11]|uniref:baeRF3 domain-containing protein n=1 Tax=Mucilaginibacter sp. UR6-11 TaxID=1435644 RepID=UPI001E50616C|nr:hypothetical protein [Mucilaginibacter sp. UR6-11]MCC8426394.1 hypothetical protein [Mucilaginibacter sp. UR6-11]
MNTAIDPEIREVMDAIHYRPALSIILPLEPHISLKTEMAHTLKITADKAERELHEYYPDEQCEVVMKKLQSLIAGTDIPVKKKGMALFVSPLFEKVLYLDYPVTERLIVDESFEVRDLLYNAKQDVKFILLVLSALESKVYLGDHTSLTPLLSNIPGSVYAYVTDTPERVSNFSDMTEHNQTIVDKFLHHIDEELGNLINERHLPVLLLGAERILGQFKKISKHTGQVMDYVEGNYESYTAVELTELIQPHIAAWKISKQQDLLKRLDDAAGQHRLSTGIRQIWHDVHNGKGKLLIVEKSYRFAAQHGPESDVIEAATEPYDHFAYIRDAVDDVIEKVLINGGDVEFAEDGALEQFEHIVLINYY